MRVPVWIGSRRGKTSLTFLTSHAPASLTLDPAHLHRVTFDLDLGMRAKIGSWPDERCISGDGL